MRSDVPSEPLDLERDLPTSAEDSRALRRAKRARPLDLEAYLRFLAQLPSVDHDRLRSRPGPRGDEPFVL